MDDRSFRNAMGTFATGVTVVTAEVGQEVFGMTANAFMSVSLDPKLIAVSVDEKASMHGKLPQAGKFAVSILTNKQEKLSMVFAGQIEPGGLFEFDRVEDVPVIPEALTTIVCDLHSSHRAGDHTIYVGEVKEIVEGSGDPLTFFKGRYGQMVSEPNTAANE